MLNTVMPSDLVESPAAEPTVHRPALRRGVIIKAVALGALVLFVAECLRVFVGSNFHTVLPGKCYRSAQPTLESLTSAQRKHGIRTIINLRDENEGEPWYDEEKRAAQQLGIRLINAGLSSKEQAPTEDFRNFVRAVRDAEEPVLIHCANGNDRSGLASAAYLIMRTNTSLEEARGQLSLRFGHVAWSKASCLSRVLDSYEGWLAETRRKHSAEHFYEWGMNVYRPEVFE